MVVAVIGVAMAAGVPAAAQDVAAAGAAAAQPDTAALRAMLATLPAVDPPPLDNARAIWLATLPLACMDRVQPRPTTRPYFWIATARLVDDHESTRAFWGCNDWASAASSTWAVVRMLKSFPGSMDVLARERLDELAREKLTSHLGRSNFEGELAFFREAGQFQRPYGYAWLLKLQAELQTWPDSAVKAWAANAAPLAAWMADRLTLYLAELERPVRTGGQTNTALIIALALDYAEAGDAGLRTALRSSALRYYEDERECDTRAEADAVPRGRGAAVAAAPGAPAAGARGGEAGRTGRGGGRGGRGGGRGGGGSDVVSPCLAVAALMARVLEPAEYLTWLNGFLPPLHSEQFAPLTQPPDSAAAAAAVGRGGRGAAQGGRAAEGRGGEARGGVGGGGVGRGGGPTGVARLAGLSLQRAEAMERIAAALPESDPRVPVLRRLSAMHAARAFELARDDAAGAHWVPAYAVLYFTARQ